MIKNIIFDLGGVIIGHERDLMPTIIGSVFGLTPDKGRQIWHEYKDALLTGELPSESFLRTVRDRLAIKTPLRKLRGLWRSLYEESARTLNEPLIAAIGKLRERYRVLLLTDTFEVHHEHNVRRGLYAHFDGVYASHLERKSKSQGSAAFERFLTKFSLIPSECVFVDDMEAYIEVAKSLGIHGVHFTSNERLLKSLQDLGVVI